MKKLLLLTAAMLSCLSLAASKPQLKFAKDGSFKIVQFTDTHIRTTLVEETASVYALMKEVIEAEKPDLIVLTGDNITVNPCAPEIERLTGFLDSFKTPWCLVFGNHDEQQELTRPQMSEMYASAKYSLNKLNGKGELADLELRIASKNGADKDFYIFCLDSHSYASVNGIECYDWISEDQVEWLSNCCKARTDAEGHVAPALAFFHIPLCEYVDAWAPMENPRISTSKYECLGIRGENVACPGLNSGMFAAMEQSGSVIGVSVGHDHDNDFLAVLKGIALCYGRFSGAGSVYNHLPHGARVFVVKEGERGFETWIRELGGRIVRHTYFDGQTLNNAKRDRSKPYGTWADIER